MRRLVVAALLAALVGCARQSPPLSGGKPVSHWVDTLKSGPDARERKKAAFELGNVGPTDPSAQPALIAALKDRDAAARCAAIAALLKFGPAARAAIPALTELRERDGNARVRA